MNTFLLSKLLELGRVIYFALSNRSFSRLSEEDMMEIMAAKDVNKDGYVDDKKKLPVNIHVPAYTYCQTPS